MILSKSPKSTGGLRSFRPFPFRLLSAALCGTALLASSTIAAAAPGDADPTFGTQGLVVSTFPEEDQFVWDMKLLSDGKILAGASHGLVRYHADGALDMAFGTDGVAVSGDKCGSVAVQSGGKIVTSGYDRLYRFHSDGTPDTAFLGEPLHTPVSEYDFSTYYIIRLAVQSSGKILVAGVFFDEVYDEEFNEISYGTYAALVRCNEDGSIDTTFGNQGVVQEIFEGEGQFFDVAVDTGDGIVATGISVNYAARRSSAVLARYDSNGQPDMDFGMGGIVSAGPGTEFSVVQVQSDGGVLAAGTGHGDFVVARYHFDGSPDTGFGTGGRAVTDFGRNSYIAGIAVQSDGRIVAAGGTAGKFALARYNANGSADAGFGVGGRKTTSFAGGAGISSIILQSSGRIVVGGYSGAYPENKITLAGYLSAGAQPTYITTLAPMVTPSGATLRARANANGMAGGVTALSFVYNRVGTSSFSSVRAMPMVVTGNSNTVVSATVKGLPQGAVYNVYVRGRVGGETVYGAVQQWQVPPAPARMAPRAAVSIPNPDR